MTNPKTITVERLREVLSYDPETGNFTYLVGRANVPAGTVTAGYRSGEYLELCIDYERIKAHVVAWVIVTGEWPPMIDHEDTNKLNNRIWLKDPLLPFPLNPGALYHQLSQPCSGKQPLRAR